MKVKLININCLIVTNNIMKSNSLFLNNIYEIDKSVMRDGKKAYFIEGCYYLTSAFEIVEEDKPHIYDDQGYIIEEED